MGTGGGAKRHRHDDRLLTASSNPPFNTANLSEIKPYRLYRADMKPKWSVAIDPSRRLLLLSIEGFFAPSDVNQFAAEVANAIGRLRPFLNGVAHVTICDVRHAQIQSQDAVEAFSSMLANPAARSRRLAYVVDAMLAQMQIGRLTGREDARFFRTPEEAEAWVLAD